MSSARPVLVAPDKFRGSMSATEVATAIGRGLIDGGREPVELLPVADGGEGSMETLVRALGGQLVPVEVSDPLGRRVHAAIGLLDGGRRAIVEMAQASGLWRLKRTERDALGASSAGTGELIDAAIDAGAKTVIVAVGGSATTDGGRGALEALGARFGKQKANLRELRRRLRGVKLLIACDVRNPMCGASGAARVFAPQKGASESDVELLEEGLEQWSKLAKRSTKRDPANEPMAGAAGGLAGGLWAFAGGQLKLGAPLLLDEIGFDAQMRAAYAVVTGEGTLDAQTLHGKLVFEVATRCRQAGVPCYGVVGHDQLDAFGKRVMNIEVEPAALPGQEADGGDLAQAARRLAKHL